MIFETIRGLFVNMTILTSFIMFGNMIMYDKFVGKSLKSNITYGILSGIFGCLLMLFSVRISNQVILDFRYIPVIMMAIYVSSYAAAETALIMGLFRLVYFGINQASVTACIVIILLGIVSGAIGRTKLSIRDKWILCVGFSIIVTGYSIYTLIYENENRSYVLLVFLSGLVSVSVLMYYFLEFLNKFNEKIDNIKNEAEKDYLTGLKNPRQFDKILKNHLNENTGASEKVALLYIDIDHFKEINDQYGHNSGDLVLKELGRIFKSLARSQDIISRRGGEEFTMLLVDCQLEQAAVVAERIRFAVENAEFKLSEESSIHITVSIGVAALQPSVTDGAKLLEQADKALYQAKETGRNKVVVI